jgi:DNA polymerase III epsilon subunit-like protein
VAHHVKFDLDMLEIENLHGGFCPREMLPDREYCTMVESAQRLKIPYGDGGWKLPSLDLAVRKLTSRTVDTEQLHDAEYDTDLCVDLFLALRKSDSL